MEPDPTQKETALIEAYLDGDLNETETQAFEVRLHEDPDWQLQVQAQRLVREGMQHLKQAAFLKEVQNWEAEAQEQERESNILVLWLPRLAVAVAVLLLAWVGLKWYARAQYGNEVLLAEAYIPYQSQQVKSGPESSDSKLPVGFQEVADGDCAAAIPALQKVPATDSRYLQARYYLGHCYLQTEAYPEAVAAFASVLEADTFPEVGNARLNYYLAQLNAGAPDSEVLTQLSQIPEDATPGYRRQAERLAEKLRSGWRSLAH